MARPIVVFDLSLAQCPVTCGRPTRMSEAAFRRACEARRGLHMGRIAKDGTARLITGGKLCAGCDGRPNELDIIKPEELDMGKKTGVCDICGERKELKHAARGGGLDVCTSCYGLLTAAGKPELLAKAVRLAGMEGAMTEALGGPDGNAPDPARTQYESYMGEAMGHLARVLPHEDEGLDDTRSFADLPDFAERAAMKITADAAELHTLRDMLKPAEHETLIRAATRMVPAAKAWKALMARARDAGFADIADGDPEIMASTYIMAMTEVMRERDDLKAELAEARERIEAQKRHIHADQATDPVNNALLEWALKGVASGKLAVRVQVTELEEAASCE